MVTDVGAWSALTTPGYCLNSNDDGNKVVFGALYNWYAVNSGKLAPAGWHVPTDAEWNTLENYLIAHGYNWDGTTTGNKISKSLASKSEWQVSDAEGGIGRNLTRNNRSEFSATPGGYRFIDGYFTSPGNDAYFWSATEENASYAWNRYLFYVNSNLTRTSKHKNYGFSVRLVRD